MQAGISIICLVETFKEFRTDDTSTVLNTCDSTDIQTLITFQACSTNEGHSLGIIADLRHIQRLAYVVDDGLWFCRVVHSPTDSVLQVQQPLSEQGLHVSLLPDMSIPRAFRTCLVEDLVEQVGTVGDNVVRLAQDLCCDFDEERLQHRVVPLFEDIRGLRLGETCNILREFVRLADEVHVSILGAEIQDD